METREGTFGLFELSSDGTVLYSRAAYNGHGGMQPAETIGLDFFREVAAFTNKEDLRHHFRSFVVGSKPVDSFGFECEYGEISVRTKITMTRGHETADEHTASIVIMDIKQLGN
jgi:hypothetical protein